MINIDEHIESPPANNRWIISFADLLSIILAFFVLIFSSLQTNIKPTTQKNSGIAASPNTQLNNVEIASPKEKYNLDYLKNVISEKLNSDPDLSSVNLNTSSNRIILEMKESSLDNNLTKKLSEVIKNNNFVIYTSSLDKSSEIRKNFEQYLPEKRINFFASDVYLGKITLAIKP
jgi:hypothetical protein